jgi:hypothetical protein
LNTEGNLDVPSVDTLSNRPVGFIAIVGFVAFWVEFARSAINETRVLVLFALSKKAIPSVEVVNALIYSCPDNESFGCNYVLLFMTV